MVCLTVALAWMVFIVLSPGGDKAVDLFFSERQLLLVQDISNRRSFLVDDLGVNSTIRGTIMESS
jgi:hypothetical protein